MSAKHTPGPWSLNEVRTDCGRAFRIGAGEMLTAGKGCCIIYDDYPGNPDNERAANARLIAAAPDMLAALKEAEGELYQVPPADAEQERVLAIVRAAISKAEGQ